MASISDDELEEGQIEDDTTHKTVPKPMLSTREIVDYSDIAMNNEERESLHEMHHARQRSRSTERPTDRSCQETATLTINAYQVSSILSQSKSLSELMRHVRDNRQGFDSCFDCICASAAVSKAAKMMNKRSQSDVDDFLELVEIARGYLPEMEARGLSNFIYSLAKSGLYKDQLIQEFFFQAEPKLSDFDPQGLTNTIWALATLNYKDEVFIKQLLKGAESKLRDFNPQALANTIWALATLNHKDEVFIKQLLKEVEPKLRDFEPQNLANFIWALATLDCKDEVFIEQLLKEAEPKLRDFNPQGLANTIWALATLDYKDEWLIKQLLKEAQPKLRDFDPQALANTIWALATLTYNDVVFIKWLLLEAEPRLQDFNPQNLANFIWALATFNYKDKVFVAQLLREAEPKLRGFTPQGLTTTAWSLAVFDHSVSPSFLPRFLPLAYEMVYKMGEKGKTQCLQYLLLMEDGEHVTAEIKSDPRYVQLRRMCQEANARSNDITSQTQLEIFEAVCCLPGCSDATSEHLTEDGLFRIDIALQLSGGQKLAIEVDGPYHFLTDGKTLNGSTILRNRLLENRGWKVISIPLTTEWSPLSGVGQKEAYLINKLSPFFIISSGDMKRS